MMRVWPACLFLLLAWVVPAGAQPHDYLKIGVSSFPTDMHPLIFGNTTSRNYVLDAARRAVTRYDADGKPVCQLCTDLPTLENGGAKLVPLPDGGTGMDVTFTLRPGLKWGDGTALTTKDILFGAELERLSYPRTNQVGVVALDDRSYTVKFRAPRFDFQRLSPQPVNAAIEEPLLRASKDLLDYGAHSAFNCAPETPGLWNGPYLITGFKPNEIVTFAPNPYWDGEKPAFRQVTMRPIDNTAALQANLLSGDIDIANGLTFDQGLDLQKRYADRLDVTFVPAFTTYWLYLRDDNPLLADKRVRQAMMLAIDRNTIVARLFGGKLPVASSIFPAIDPNFDADLKPWPYDPARARAMLADAGYTAGPDGVLQHADGTRLSLDLIVSAGNRTSELLQQVVQSQLKQVGVETVAQAQPDRTLWGFRMPRRQFDGIVMGTDSMSPDVIPQSDFATTGIPVRANGFHGDNLSGYSNPQVDAEMLAAYTELDRGKRKAMLDDMQAKIMDDLPRLPLYNGANIYVTPKWLTGLTPPRSTYVATLWIEYWKPR